jgi:uncharacterized membrane protein
MSADAPAPLPSSREFTMLGITYGLFAIGLVMFWPAFIAMVIAVVKRRDAADTFLASHYTWLIRTFWWWTLWFVLATFGVLAIVVPDAVEMARAMQATDRMVLSWKVLGGAAAGGVVFLAVWCWVVYRLIRGTLRLADGRSVP